MATSGAITPAVVRAVGDSRYPALATGVGAVAIVLLLALLIEHELLRVRGARLANRRRVLVFAIVPLLLAFAFVVSLRLIELVGYRR